MVSVNDIKNLISKMTEDVNSNIKNICSLFGTLDYTDDDEQSILHILVDDEYDEEKCFLAIKSLLQAGLSPNLEEDFNYNFIQVALYSGYSEKFILNIITEALKYKLNINHVDSDGDTIMHTVIYSDYYLGSIEKIYDLLCKNGYNSTIKDKEGKNLLQALEFMDSYKHYSEETKEKFKKVFEKRCEDIYRREKIAIDNKYNYFKENNMSNIFPVNEKNPSVTGSNLANSDILQLEKYGIILNNKNYLFTPTIGRERELKNLMICLAQDKKRPLIVGESGVGKTAIVDELAYRIKMGQVPSFLQGKIILEVNPSDIVAGCQYVGMFEENMTKLMKLCEKFDVIVFIDEIHTIYGIGSTKNKDNDMASLLKYYIDRSNLKVIGTTTENEYNEFFSNDALKRRFEKITVKEPNEEVLYQIIIKVIEDYCMKNRISFENENIRNQVVNIILNATKKSHRVYDDMINNPDLAISILDRAFAFAKFYDSKFITVEHFIECFEFCDRIYDSSKKEAIEKLKNIDKSISKPAQKILKIDFNAYRK